MTVDLREIIEIPGRRVPFSCEINAEMLELPGVFRFVTLPHAEGEIVNSAGALTLHGTLRADMLCVCDRCGTEFESEKLMELHIPLVADTEDDENPDVFPLDGDSLDLDEVLGTCLLLDMETKFLCREDCKGLCESCGADLNLGPCSCTKLRDPRMAVLEQLLENK